MTRSTSDLAHDVRPRVGVWRSVWLPSSETFVRRHVDSLSRWNATTFGLNKVPSSLASPEDVILYSDSSAGRALATGFRLSRRSQRIDRHIHESRFDLIHAHFGPDGTFIAPSARRAKVPLIITLHGADVGVALQGHDAGQLLYQRRVRRLSAPAVRFLAVSDALARRAVSAGIDRQSVGVHYLGVPIPDRPASGAKSWDVLFIGRFVEKKGVLDFISAIAEISDTLPQLRAAMIGDGPLLGAARTMAAAAGTQISMLGSLTSEQTMAHLAASRILLVPSRTARSGDMEGLPTVCMEAGARSIPVVATDHSGIPEIVIDGQTGYLVDEGDFRSAARRCVDLLQNGSLALKLGESGRSRVSSVFNAARQASRLEDLYDQLAFSGTRDAKSMGYQL